MQESSSLVWMIDLLHVFDVLPELRPAIFASGPIVSDRLEKIPFGRQADILRQQAIYLLLDQIDTLPAQANWI